MQFDALVLLAVPPTAPHAVVGGSDVAGLGEEQRHRVFGGADDVRLRSIHHQDAGRRRRAQVDVVDPDTRASHHFELWGSSEQLGVDRGRRAHHEAVRIAHPHQQFVTLHTGCDVDVATRCQRLDAGWRDRFGYDHLGPHRVHLLNGAILPDRSRCTKPTEPPTGDVE